MPLNITWDEPGSRPPLSSQVNIPPSANITDTRPRKLKKRVSFAASTKSDVSTKTDTSTKPVEDTGPSSTDVTPEKGNWWSSKGNKAEAESPSSPSSPGWITRMRSKQGKKPLPLPEPQNDPSLDLITPPSPGPSTWHHHDRYFPLFSETDIFGPAPARAPAHTPYSFSSPFENALTPMELQAIEHSKLSGRPVVVHYPELPAFKDYLQGKTPESIGWNSAKWGTEGWTGYGWGGEVLPDKDGKTFGAGMPEGKLPPGAQSGKKKKKGKGEEGEEGEEGGEEEGEGEGEEKAEGDAPAQPAQGGGGGKKKKKK